MIKDYKTGQKVIINKDIHTPNGVLYKESIVKIDAIGFPDKDIRVTDDIGKIWYLNFSDVENITT
tara:strand:+ start:1043 stop:1237 length:195 start_codon:yes stop_codon:yes gene_type:complete